MRDRDITSDLRYRTSQNYRQPDASGMPFSNALFDCLQHLNGLCNRGLSAVIDPATRHYLSEQREVVNALETELCLQRDAELGIQATGYPSQPYVGTDVLRDHLTIRDRLLHDLTTSVFPLLSTADDQLRTAESNVTFGRFRPRRVYLEANDNTSGRAFENSQRIVIALREIIQRASTELRLPASA